MSDGLNRKSVSDGLSRKSVSDGLKANAQQLYMYGLKAHQYIAQGNALGLVFRIFLRAL